MNKRYAITKRIDMGKHVLTSPPTARYMFDSAYDAEKELESFLLKYGDGAIKHIFDCELVDLSVGEFECDADGDPKTIYSHHHTFTLKTAKAAVARALEEGRATERAKLALEWLAKKAAATDKGFGTT